ncbi:hypothetical protein RIVM261_038840 [Rivularia sp. IAM M-261]|nr:hypothetical protein CAL7716_077900 [Calothrix sp. PCC 7716]GJD18928.1 hypothetical protein RIVM261_038840 [Rivularia sp. IAM M-261]
MIRYVLDTDHISLYERAHPQVSSRIIDIRQNSLDILSTTVVTVEEQYAGRIAQIRKAVTAQALIKAYERLKQTFAVLLEFDILEYNLQADQYLREFRKAGIRIGTQDLRIACIVIAHGSVLLTRNRQDFEKVPGLNIQDWSI